MPRKPRENVAGGIYHAYAHGVARERIFRDDVDRHTYIWLLGRVAPEHRWRCLAYCLMENHVHLLLETPEGNLSEGMHRLQGGFAQVFNARHGRVGHVFQGRYGAVRITSDRQLWTTARYIARNPVEAGLCQKPTDWAWSSHSATLDGSEPDWLDVARLLSFFGPQEDAARETYAQLSSVDLTRGQTP